MATQLTSIEHTGRVRHASVVQVRARLEVCYRTLPVEFVDKSGNDFVPKQKTHAKPVLCVSPSCSVFAVDQDGGGATAPSCRRSAGGTVASPARGSTLRNRRGGPIRGRAAAAAPAGIFLISARYGPAVLTPPLPAHEGVGGGGDRPHVAPAAWMTRVSCMRAHRDALHGSSASSSARVSTSRMSS